MLAFDTLTFNEFAMGESLPLAIVHEAIFHFLRDRQDAVVFGAHAVNAYVDEPRMTQDVDILALDAGKLTLELQAYLTERFHVAIRTRELTAGVAYRMYQVRKPQNRHLANIRAANELPATQRIEGVLVPIPAELVAYKIISFVARKGKPKAGSDWRDLALLLLAFPDLKTEQSAVVDLLRAHAASEEAITAWISLANSTITPDDQDEGY